MSNRPHQSTRGSSSCRWRVDDFQGFLFRPVGQPAHGRRQLGCSRVVGRRGEQRRQNHSPATHPPSA